MVKRVVCALVVIATIPSTASAVDVQALLAQIEALRAQILTLQGLGAAQNSAVTTCDVPVKPLRRGSTGIEVTRLQEFLAHDAAIYPEGTVTGYFGVLTERAVQRFQTARGIVTSGTPETTGYGAVGPRTLKALAAEWCLHSRLAPNPFTPSPGSFVPQNQSSKPATSTGAKPPPPPAPIPRLGFTAPSASSTVNKGSSLIASWKTEAAPLTGFVALSLQTKSGETIGTIKSGLPMSGSHYFAIPNPPAPPTSVCTADPATCLSQMAATQPDCGPFCTLSTGLYKFYAQLYSGSKEVAHAESRIFSVGGAVLSSIDLAFTGSTWSAPASTIDYSSLYGTSSASVLYGAPQVGASCTYSGVLYNEGITVEINCADVTSPNQVCGSFGGLQMTCKAGKWVDQNGVAKDVRNVTTTYTPGSCITPWQAQVVGNGQLIPREPFFTDGVYASAGAPLIMKCNNGSWQTCDTVGFNCR